MANNLEVAVIIGSRKTIKDRHVKQSFAFVKQSKNVLLAIRESKVVARLRNFTRCRHYR